MEWWKLGLEFTKVLIWPLVILTLGLVFKRPISGIFKRGFEAEAAGLKLRVDAAEEALQRATQVGLDQLPEVPSESPGHEEAEPNVLANGAEDPANNQAGEAPQQTNEEDTQLKELAAQFETRLMEVEQERRQAVEQVLAKGAQIGWEWARIGEHRPPEFDVHWTREGHPSITVNRPPQNPLDSLSTKGRARLASSTANHIARKNNLENEIRATEEAAIKAQQFGRLEDRLVHEERLKHLRVELAIIDPTSALI
ncbi:hypothetical protein [Streptosporangium sp. NPDC049078]|uniref:hypothetical protein n=1 Tax=Streptosporangium sp. NPDC049078 TaxID=3155767 RepID=UPI00343AFDB3